MIFVKRSYVGVIEHSCDRGEQGAHYFEAPPICEITKQALHLIHINKKKPNGMIYSPKIKDL